MDAASAAFSYQEFVVDINTKVILEMKRRAEQEAKPQEQAKNKSNQSQKINLKKQ